VCSSRTGAERKGATQVRSSDPRRHPRPYMWHYASDEAGVALTRPSAIAGGIGTSARPQRAPKNPPGAEGRSRAPVARELIGT